MGKKLSQIQISYDIFFHLQLVQGAKQSIGAFVTIKSRSVDKWYTDHRSSQGKLERRNKFPISMACISRYTS